MRFVSTALVMTTIALMLLALMLLGPLAHAKSVGANESPSNNSQTMGIERLASRQRLQEGYRHVGTLTPVSNMTATTHFGGPKRLTPRSTNTASETIADVHRDQIL